MIAGIGVDIIDIKRINETFNKFGNKFAKRILTDEELNQFIKKKSSSAYLAKRFAAKEAVTKALGTGIGIVSFKDIAIINNRAGAPEVILFGNALELCDQKQVTNVKISLSDEIDYAVAFVVIEKQ